MWLLVPIQLLTVFDPLLELLHCTQIMELCKGLIQRPKAYIPSMATVFARVEVEQRRKHPRHQQAQHCLLLIRQSLRLARQTLEVRRQPIQ